MTRTIFPEFREQQESSLYPFVDGASLLSTTGQVIERDTFLDATLYPIGATAEVRINAIDVQPRRVTIHIGTARTILASGSFDPAAAGDAVTFTDALGRPAGLLVSDAARLARFGAWAVQLHTFSVRTTEFVSACVIPTPEAGVRGLRLPSGELLTGNVWLVGDSGVVVRNVDGNIRVDIVGDPLFKRRLCVPQRLFSTPRFIRTINGCAPDSNGFWHFTVSSETAAHTIIRAYQSAEGITLEAVGKVAT